MFLKKGFTLIEMMIVIGIIGILASIAYPMYTKHVKDGRRSEATSALEILASQQAIFYNNSALSVYAGAIGALGAATTTNNFYNLAVNQPVNATSYVLSATPTWADPDCNIFYLDNVGRRWVSGNYDGDGVLGGGIVVPAVIDPDDVAACWR